MAKKKRGGPRAGAGRPPKRGGGESGALMREIGKAQRKKGVTSTLRPSVTTRQKRVRKRGIKRTRKKSIPSRAISPRHPANLIQPSRPFTGPSVRGQVGFGFRSTAIWKFRYNQAKEYLFITFVKTRMRRGVVTSRSKGGEYVYFAVPFQIYGEFLNASSKGRYFNANIKGQYQFKRI